MKTTIVLLTLAVASSAYAGSQSVTESRTHYVIANLSRTPQFYVTSVETLDEVHSSHTYLIENVATGQRLQVDIDSDSKKHEVTGRYALDGQRSATVRLQMPFISATTRREQAAEMKSHRELFDVDVPITVESKGRSEKTSEKSWNKEANLEGSRRRIKNVLDSQLSEAVKSVVPVLSYPELHAACSTIEVVSGGAKCGFSTELMIATIAPDCTFDSTFGMPCSSDRLVKAHAVKLNGRGGPY